MDACESKLGEFEKALSSEVKSLEKFFGSEPPVLDSFLYTKTLHDLAHIPYEEFAVDELLLKGFSDEQIWQQLKFALNNGDKAIEFAFTGLQRKRKRIISDMIESMSKKRRKEEDEETSDVEESITVNEKTDTKRTGSSDHDDDDDDDDVEGSDDDKDDDDEISDDEYLKEICSGWQINAKRPNGDDTEEEEEEEEEKMMGEDKEDDSEDENEETESDGEDISSSEKDYGLEVLKKSLSKSNNKMAKPSKADDRFFKEAEMNACLDKWDQEENQKGAIDAMEDDSDDDYMYRDVSSDEDEDDERNAKYSDFFDEPEGESNLKTVEEGDDDLKDDDQDESEDDLSGSDDEDEEDEDEDTDDDDEESIENKRNKEVKFLNDKNADGDQPKSAFQKRQELLRKQIDELEENNLKERPWHLRGEVTAADRPENSLLTTHVNYKFNDAPIIEDDENLPNPEEILRKNYESEAFVVNVTRKVKPTETSFRYRKEVALDQEKSKVGLADIYEKEYLAQTQKQKEVEDEQYKEDRKILDNILYGLRLMFSDGPVSVMPPKVELKVLENTPSVTVEEVAPLLVSDADRLTAEEIQGKRKGELLGTTERSKTDKNRARRKKKNFQHQLAVEKKARAAADPNSREAQEEAQKKLEIKSRKGKHVTIHETDKKKRKSKSSDFFEKLQNQVTSGIAKRKEVKKKKNEQS